MLRKTQLVSIISLLSATSSFAGLYLGASIGPEGASFSQKAHISRPGTFNAVDKNHFSGLGFFGSIFGGYGWKHDSYYLAGEINLNLSSVEYKLNNDEYLHLTFSKTFFNVKSSEGISLLPGYFLSDSTLLYGRIGYSNGRVKIVESDPTINNASKNRSGIRYGVGIRHSLTPKLDLMMDYSQINYKGIEGRVFEPFGMVTKVTKISANTAQVGFGLIYNFDQPEPVFVK